MKKLLALVLALILCLGLCACGQEKASEPQATDAPRSDIAVTPIPKPGEGDGGKTESPAVPAGPAAPAATEKPAPADIRVTDKCELKGTVTYTDGYSANYSFTLPEISGADTDYIRDVNRELDGIYDDHVAPSLEAMQSEDGYAEHYCTAYSHAETEGVHSILVTCDSDWGQDSFWCYNYDAWGEKVDNEALLALVGLTPEKFVKLARAYLTEATDLSEYFEDDGWKEYQAQTVADDNCNADMPMAILPDGNLCFIASIYTPAGAGVYDSALELRADGSVSDVSIGRIFADRLTGSYLVEGKDLDDDCNYFLEFFPVGDSLSVQVTAIDPETDNVYSYYAADIVPEDPADLLRADGAPVEVRVLSYCPDVFDGSYYGEAGLYTLTADGDSVTFSDFRGGTPIIAEAFTAEYCWSEDYGLRYTSPETDYDLFDYDQVAESGITGVWTGAYLDTDYREHSLTLELSSYGELRLRDCVDGEIPRLRYGSYYIAGADDGFAEEEGMVVFNTVTVGGYKMPYMGSCWIYVGDDGYLEVYDTEEAYSMNMLLAPTEYICCMDRAPRLRALTQARSVTRLAEGDTFEADVMGTGTTNKYSYTFVRDKNAGDAITSVVFSLDGEEITLNDLWLYDAEVYVVEPGRSGTVFFYIDGLSDNDYHYTDIVAADDTSYRYVGCYWGGFQGEPHDPACVVMSCRSHLLSSAGVYRSYRIGLSGMPEPIDSYFHTNSELRLTAKRDVDAWKADAETGELYYDVVLKEGTEVSFLRTDGSSFWDLMGSDGECYRVWISTGDGPQTIGGVDIEDCFDGIRFAG